MQEEGKVPRRQQYSSCDECRRARVACDAGRSTVSGSKNCTRCHNRSRKCTFEWMRDVKPSARTTYKTNSKAHRARKESLTENGGPASRNGADTTTNGRRIERLYSFSGFSPSSLSTEEPLSPRDDQWLRTIYSETWETVFGNWLSKYSCPFVFGDDSIPESFVSISALCTQLDRWMVADSTAATSPRTYPGFGDLTADDETDRQTHQSLELVIRAYAARWLPLVSTSDPQSCQESIANLWREARRDMLKIMNRPSYRSMLALYLFGLTPIPEGITDEEELDGMPGPVCVQAALQQVYMLRVRQKTLQFSGSKVSPTVTAKQFSISPDPAATNSFINAENIAHWAALTFDTSASLTLSSRPILSSGLFGFESDWCWSLVRSCTELFQEMSKEWHASSLEMTECRANQVVAAGSAFKLLMWKLSAVLREALRDGHDESALMRVFNAILEAIDTFNATYRDLLEICQKRIHFLSQETKLRWYVLMLHYNVSILLAVDAIEATQRLDLLPRLSAARTDAESCIINTLAFGLETSYTITLRSHSSPGSEQSSHSGRITVALLAIDPYPHHVLACVQIMRRAIQRDLASETLTTDTYSNLASILQRVLHLLPGSSKSVQSARMQVEAEVSGT